MKFNRYHVTDGTTKARCFYSLDNRTDGRSCVTIYARDYGSGLGRMFADAYHNDSDSMTDYFEKGRVVLFEDHPLYKQARAAVEKHNAAEKAKQDARMAKIAAAHA